MEKRLTADSHLEDRSGFRCDTVMSMLNLCLSARQFQFRGKHYELRDALALGSPESSPVANIFMADLETEALESFPGTFRSKCFRHVYNTISIVKRSLVNKLLDHLSSRHKNMQFTIEVEKDIRLPIRDALLNL